MEITKICSDFKAGIILCYEISRKIIFLGLWARFFSVYLPATLFSDSPYAPALNNWEEAFNELRTLIERKPKDERKVIFFDEMPWIDTKQSQFVEALEYFWNAWAAQRTDILFIACGSATSWMVNKLIKNQGGLHNRITEQIYLRPFRLGECEEFLHANGCVWDRYTILQGYMAMAVFLIT